jgi:hypothetical protein
MQSGMRPNSYLNASGANRIAKIDSCCQFHLYLNQIDTMTCLKKLIFICAKKLDPHELCMIQGELVFLR